MKIDQKICAAEPLTVQPFVSSVSEFSSVEADKFRSFARPLNSFILQDARLLDALLAFEAISTGTLISPICSTAFALYV
jgi:hypothetical protein